VSRSREASPHTKVEHEDSSVMGDEDQSRRRPSRRGSIGNSSQRRTQSRRTLDESENDKDASMEGSKKGNEESGTRRRSPPRSTHSRRDGGSRTTSPSFPRNTSRSVSPTASNHRRRSPSSRNRNASPSAASSSVRRARSTSVSARHRRGASPTTRSALDMGTEGSETPAPKAVSTVAPPTGRQRRNSLTIANVFDLEPSNNDIAPDALSVGESVSSQSTADAGDTIMQFDPSNRGSIASFKVGANDESLNNSGVFKMENLTANEKQRERNPKKPGYLPGSMDVPKRSGGEGRSRHRPGRRESRRGHSPVNSIQGKQHRQSIGSINNGSESMLDGSNYDESLRDSSSVLDNEQGNTSDIGSSSNRHSRRQRLRDRRRQKEPSRQPLRTSSRRTDDEEEEESEDDRAGGYLPQSIASGNNPGPHQSSLDDASSGSVNKTDKDEEESNDERESDNDVKQRRSSTLDYIKKQLKRTKSRSVDRDAAAAVGTTEDSGSVSDAGTAVTQGSEHTATSADSEPKGVKKKLKKLLKKAKEKKKNRKHAQLLDSGESDCEESDA